MPFPLMSEKQLDALREISNVGMGHAATALSQLTGKTINLAVPRVKFADIADMPACFGGHASQVVGIYLRMLGNAQGYILMIFPRENALRILEKLLPPQGSGGTLSELELSALAEVGNILASAYLNALGELLRMTLIPSVPHMSIDRAGTVIDQALASFGEVGDHVLVLDTEFFSRDERVSGQFFLLPAPGSLDSILAALGVDQA